MLSLVECEEISRGLAAGQSIAGSLGRAPFKISREIGRNDVAEGYCASQADHAAWDQARRPKPRKLSVCRANTRPSPRDVGNSR